MLLPKRVKYRRVHRGRMTGKALRGNKVTYGDFGLQNVFVERRNLNYTRKFPSFARRNVGIRLYDGGYSVRSGYSEQVKR